MPYVLFVEVLRRPHPRHQQGPGIDGGTLRVEGHSDGVGVCAVPQSGDEALVLRQGGTTPLVLAIVRGPPSVSPVGRR